MGPREMIYLEVEYPLDGGFAWARIGLLDAEVSPRPGWRGMIAAAAVEDPVERIRALPLVGAYLVQCHETRSPFAFRVTTEAGEAWAAHYYVDSIVVEEFEHVIDGRKGGVGIEFMLSGASAPVPLPAHRKET